MSKIDLEQLRREVRVMERSHALYRVLRDELKSLGYWRSRRRGNPSKGYRVMRQGKIYDDNPI